jgi:hypothetical protein
LGCDAAHQRSVWADRFLALSIFFKVTQIFCFPYKKTYICRYPAKVLMFEIPRSSRALKVLLPLSAYLDKPPGIRRRCMHAQPPTASRPPMTIRFGKRTAQITCPTRPAAMQQGTSLGGIRVDTMAPLCRLARRGRRRSCCSLCFSS